MSSLAHTTGHDTYKRIPRYLLPPQTILRDPAVVVLNEDEIISTETPLMNGLFFTEFTNTIVSGLLIIRRAYSFKMLMDMFLRFFFL